MRNEWWTLRDKFEGLQVGGKCLYLVAKASQSESSWKECKRRSCDALSRKLDNDLTRQVLLDRRTGRTEDAEQSTWEPAAPGGWRGALHCGRQPVLSASPPEIAEVLIETSAGTFPAAKLPAQQIRAMLAIKNPSCGRLLIIWQLKIFSALSKVWICFIAGRPTR